MTERALEYLQRDPLLHMDMIEPIRRGCAEIIHVRENGVLIRECRSGAFMITTDSSAATESLLSGIDRADLFVAHQEFSIPILVRKYGLKLALDCVQAVYAGKSRLPVDDGITIRRLGVEWFDAVAANYHTVDDPDYIRELLESGWIFGAMVDGNLAGFIGMHDEGAMGLLEVLPPYRRSGIGRALESHLVNLILDMGWVPFGQVRSGNTQSLLLQEKLGFRISDNHLYWLT